MAWVYKDGRPCEPGPCDAGEWVSNYYPKRRPESPEEAEKNEKAWLANKRFGRPRPTQKYTTEELEAMGMVGLYLTEDQPVVPWGKRVPTPPELQEPEVPRETGE